MPLVLLLLVYLLGCDPSIFEHSQVTLEFLALQLLHAGFSQGSKCHWLCYKGHHSVLQEQCDNSVLLCWRKCTVAGFAKVDNVARIFSNKNIV